MSAKLIRYSVSDNIAELMLDRAPVNALSMDLIDALLAALAKARDDDTVRAVIIASAHKVFCAGLDLDIVRGKPGIETKKFSSGSILHSTIPSIGWASRPSRRSTARYWPAG
jgi:enoyl-CoA hydratase